MVEIPSEIDGYLVTEIGSEAFHYQKMKSLSIPESVRTIGRRSIEYCVITDTLELPEKATIESDAFSYTELPSVVTIPAGTTVEKCAFSYCEKMEQLLIDPDSVLKGRAFSYCYDLEKVVCADGCSMEAKAFEYCRSLGTVILCGDVSTAENSFYKCGETEVTEEEESAYDNWKQSAFDGSFTGGVTGGWEVTRDSSVTEEAQAVFDQAMPDHDLVDYDAVALLATQVVAGKNYCFLCRTSVTGSNEASSYQLVYIWQDLQGNAHVLEVKDIEFGLSEEAASFPEDPEEIVLEILGSPASQGDVTVVLDKATAKKNGKTGYEYSFSGTIENNSDEGIMKVIYTFALIDENGEEYRSFGEVFDGEDTAIPPHTTIEFSHDGIKWGPQSIPAVVSLGISSVKTETELPPAHIPQKGEYLYQTLGDEKLAKIKEEPPVELYFHIDQGGYGRTATFTEGEELDRAVELLCGIQIGEESNEWVTDNYNWIGITWADGSHSGISLNLSNLEYSIHSSLHTYELENLGEFWAFCYDYLEED